MDFLITAKYSKDGEPVKQTIMDEHKTLNLVRKSMFTLQPMDETSADLQAISFMNEVKNGQPKGIENRQNGAVLIFQVFKEN